MIKENKSDNKKPSFNKNLIIKFIYICIYTLNIYYINFYYYNYCFIDRVPNVNKVCKDLTNKQYIIFYKKNNLDYNLNIKNDIIYTIIIILIIYFFSGTYILFIIKKANKKLLIIVSSILYILGLIGIISYCIKLNYSDFILCNNDYYLCLNVNDIELIFNKIFWYSQIIYCLIIAFFDLFENF